MADAESAIADMIRSVRAMGRMATDAAPDCAEQFEAALKADLAAGRTPGGPAWAPTKKGEQPLKNAAAAVKITIVGSVLLARLSGHHVWHHYGTGKVPRRQILPSGGIPDSIGEAIKQGLVNFWDREVAG